MRKFGVSSLIFGILTIIACSLMYGMVNESINILKSNLTNDVQAQWDKLDPIFKVNQ